EDMTHAALNFMDTAAGRPFFLYFNIWEVHTGMAAKKRYVDYYKKKLENYKGKEKINPVYAAEVTVVDNCVRDIYNKVQELGIADNTIIMFTSDNGGLPEMTNNKPLRAGKGSLFEGGIRDPFVTVWPGVVKPGSETDYVVTGVDLLPTFAQIAKAALPTEQPVDGKSFLKVLEGENITERGAVYWHYPLYLSGGKKGKVLPIYGTNKPYWRAVPSSAIMKDDWKLIYYHEYDNYKLFNIKNDIGEKHNLADTDTLIAKELYDDLVKWIDQTGAPFPSQPNPDFKQFQ
ncbi:MAG: sulfatase-like hydrolase/transferase, partial [Bacteroidales bacterium]|nr:sulfatase-like hydrolase/transferase [Bacteroidales bacterium]